MKRKLALSIFIFSFCFTYVFSQQPEDCGLPSPPGEDLCDDACVYCDLTANGYSGSTIGYTPDAPNNYCGTIENNQWFAFAAGTTTVEFTIIASNCSNGDGVQGAIYPDCDPNSPFIACDGGSNNGAATPIVVTANNLVVGQIYWFMVDGWLGDQCDYDVTVTQGNTDPPPLDPPGPISGDVGCQGQTVTFSVPPLTGASYYDWTLPDGTVVNTQDPFVDYTFGQGGQVCVQANNVCNFSTQVCIDVSLVDPDAGNLTVTPATLCPNETVNISVSGYNMDPEFTQSILITDANGIVISITNGGTTSFTHNACDDFQACTYNYVTASGTPPSIGMDINTIDCDAECCEITCESFSFQDNVLPAFPNAPGDMTYACFDLLPPLTDEQWTDNCDGSGTVPGFESGSADLCNGGSLTRRWTYTDACGNEGAHIQNITVEPAPIAAFVNPPADITVDCDNIPTGASDLSYTNNGTGGCLIEGMVSPIESGSGDVCGGVITYTWEHTDQCGRTISHTQNITVTPAPAPSFINPPADVTLDCDNIPTSGPDLDYTNNGSGACLFQGTVSPQESGSADICGGVISYTWQFVDQCGNAINHVQNVTITPAPVPQFINPPADITVDCDNIPTGAPDLDYTNSGPGACLIEGTITPQQEGSADECGGQMRFTWEFVDQCGNLVSHSQNILVNPAPPVMFLNPPADITVSCDNIPASGPDLDYTNNGSGSCLFEGTVSPQESGNANICGGVLSYTWQFTDQCGNFINHVQNVTVEPAPAPSFINPPADITVSCDNIPAGGPDLNYTNNGPGVCLIEGTVSAQESGNANICGGVLSYTWQFTDQCGNFINHIQNVTVEPAPEPSFINPPDDITVSCDNIPTGAPDLQFTNNGPGVCLIEGTVSPIQSGNGSICGGEISFDWEFTDQCGNLVKHIQQVTIEPAPAPVFINPPQDMTVSCDNIPTGAEPLSYTNNAQGTCLIEGQVQPIQSGNANICGGTIIFTWQFTDQCGNSLNHVQNITVEPAPDIEFVNPPVDMVVDCADAALNPQPLEYTNNASGTCLIAGSVQPTQSGSYNECGGNITYTWQFTSICGQTIDHVQNITVNPAPPPQFTGNLPADITVTCDNVPQNPEPLSFSNNSSGICLIAGTVLPVQTGSFDECGGSLSLEWSFTDNCGNALQHQQIITVEPAPLASFINPPGPITVNCNEVQPVPPVLNYSNGAFGLCAINGVVPAIQSGFYDECGGDLTYTWVFTDDCNRTISHSQFIIVEPAPEPMFVNPPPDATISCGEDFPPPFDLVYTNGQQGLCGITGSVPPVVTEINDLEIEYTWIYSSPCSGNIIMHTQHLTENAAPDLFVDPLQAEICQGQSFDLSSIYVEDLNNTNPTITFHSGTPAFPGNQIPSPIVMPFTSTTYYILAFNPAGCMDEASFDILVEEPPFAGMDGSGTICYSESDGINLFDYLQGDPDPNGEWQDNGNTGVDLGNPFNVSLEGMPGGTYTFDYIVYSTGICPNSQASVELELLPEIIVDVMDIACTNDPDFYEVLINSNGFDIAVNTGTVNDLGNNEMSIADIDINETLIINAANPGQQICQLEILISPPDCDCPTVDPPVSDGDQSICEGEAIPQLSVQVGAEETANWYDAPVGGTLLLAGSTVYTPNVAAPGVYTFYVEAENTVTGCVSLVRTPVTLEVFENPSGNDALLDECDADGDGFIVFDLTQAESLISQNPGYSYTFYETQTDAENETNPVDVNYTNIQTPTQSLFVVITSQDGCTVIVQLTLTVYLPPSIDLELMDESCLGDADGQAIIDSPEGVNFSLDGSNWITGNTFDDLSSGTYTAYVEDTNGCISEEEFTISPGLELNLLNLEPVCNDNGTPSDPADDFYTIQFEIGNSPGIVGTYTVNDGNGDLGSFAYDESNSITVAAQGQSFILTFTDDNLPCSVQEAVGPLTTCSDECLISLDLLENSCSDNGTPADPSDDFYTVNIDASAINGGINNSYNVLIDDIVSYNFPYNTVSSFTLPANGTNPEITIEDNQNSGCEESQIIGPLNTCSNDCILTAAITNILCDDQGTGNNPDDDTYSFDLMVTGQNLSLGWESLDGNYSGTYGQIQQLGPFLISEGDISLTISDNVNQSCAILANAEAPEACSFCGQSVDAGAGTVLNCNTDEATLNGTASDPGNYTWTGPNNFEQNTLTATTSDPGWYYLTADFGSGCSSMDSVLVELDNTFPTADAGPDQTLSCDVLETELQGSGTTSSGNIGFEWFNAFNQSIGIDPILSTSIAGVYTLVITDETNGCTVTDEVEVFENNEAPEALVNEPDTLTCMTDLVTLDGSMSSGNGTLDYEWQDASGNTIGTAPSVEVGTAGNYLLIVTDTENNCVSSLPVTVPANMDIPMAIADVSDQLTCTNTSVVLDGTASSGTGPLSFEWLDPNANSIGDSPQISVGATGTYTLIVTDNESACLSETTVEVIGDPDLPVAVAGISGVIDCQIGEATLSGNGSTGTGPLDYEWFNAADVSIASTMDVSTSVPGEYYLIVTDTDNGCTSQAFIQVEIDTAAPQVIVLEPEEISCFNPEVLLDASGTSGNAALLFSWYDENDVLIGLSSTLTVDQSGTYSLVVSNTVNGCTGEAEVEVTGNADVPQANVEPGTTLTCDVNTATLDASASTGSGTLGFEWLDETGESIANTSMTQVTQPGMYTVIVSFENGCSDEAAVEILSNGEIPLADAGPNEALDCNVNQVTIGGPNTSTGSNIAYEWFDENGDLLGTDQYFETSQSGIYTLQVTNTDNNCQVTDEVEITENYTLPDVDPGPGGTLTCEVLNVLLGGSGSSSGNEYTYEWQDSSQEVLGTDSTLNVSIAGVYTFFVFNTENGCSSSASVEVFENLETPISDAGSGQELTCDDTFVTLDGSNSSGNDLIFEWLDENLDIVGNEAVVSVGSSGTYTLVVTNILTGCSDESTALVSTDENIPEAVPLVFDFLSCEMTSVVLDGTSSASNSGTIVFQWYDAQGQDLGTTSTISVQTPGIYTLVVTDPENGCSHEMNVEVEQNIEPPVANAGDDQTLTCDMTEVTLSGSASNGQNFSYEWYDDNLTLIGTTPIVNVSSTGLYELVVTSSENGCTASATVEVFPDTNIPTAEAGSGGTLTCDVFEIILDGSASDSGIDIEYEWLDENGQTLGNTVTIPVTEPGVYTLVVTNNANDCVAEDNVVVAQDTDDPTALINQIGALDCNNQSLVLNGDGSVPFGNLDFEWSTFDGNILSGQDTPNPEINEPGTYTLMVTDLDNGCTHSTSILVEEDVESPQVAIVPPGTLTCLVTELILDASASSSTGNFEYSWESDPPGGIVSGGDSLSPAIDQPGTYTLTILNLDNGCESTGFVIVDEDIAAPEAQANVYDELDCITDIVSLDGSGSSSGLPFVYLWSGPGIISPPTELNITVNQEGTYSLVVTDTQNGCTALADVFVNENENRPAGLEVLIEPPLCYGDRGSLEVFEVLGGTPPYVYSLDGGQNFYSFPIFGNLDPGVYNILVQDAIGCEYQESFTIPEVPLLVVDLGPDIIIELGTSTQLNAIVNIPVALIDSILWTPAEGLSCSDCFSPEAMPLNETLYEVLVTDINGCTARDEILIRVRKDRGIFIPNVFTPHNADGINDGFMIFSGIDDVEVVEVFQVFDRWGELVFEDYDFLPNDPAHSWDGRLRGEPMNPAVFVYWARIKFIDGVTLLYKGDVTLAR